jgi:hypothetical protein
MILIVCLVVFSLLQVAFARRDHTHGVLTTDGDEVQYLVSTETLIRDHSLSPLKNYIQNVYKRENYYQQEIPYPMLVPGTNGREVSSHLPLLPVLIVPGFWLFGYNGAAGTMILLFSLAAMLTFLSMRKFLPELTSAAVTLVFFLTYPAVTYSRLIYPETAAVFFLSLSVWASLRLKETGAAGYAMLSGVCAALLFQLHDKFIFMTVALGFLAWCCAKNRMRDFTAWLVPVVASLAVLLFLTRYLYGPNIIHGLSVAAGPGDITGGQPVWGIFGLYLDRAWGLFIFAPLYFAFLPGIPLARGGRDLSRWWLFLPIIIVLHTAVSGLFGQWFGGTAPVPRYLVPLIPIFIICAGIFYAKCRSVAVKVVLGVLFAFQLVLTVFALINPLDAFAIHGTGNALIQRILGPTLARWVTRIFPLFHPVTLKGCIIPLVLWVALLLGLSIYLRKRKMDSVYIGLGLEAGGRA